MVSVPSRVIVSSTFRFVTTSRSVWKTKGSAPTFDHDGAALTAFATRAANPVAASTTK
jgi:hypothetical protein